MTPTRSSPIRDVLYIITCGAPPSRHVDALVKLVHDDGWEACVIATPQGLTFLDTSTLEELTGYPVRSEYKDPTEPDVLPSPDAIAVAPATFNTINKWAAGISDTLALGLLTEAIGKQLPLVALPFLNTAQAAHPEFDESVNKLRALGVTVLYGPETYRLHEPGTGSQYLHKYPWHLIPASLAEQKAT